MEDLNFQKACREIIFELLNLGNKKKNTLNSIKSKYCKKYSLKMVPKNAQILKLATEEERELLIPFLRRRKTRTLSGVSVIAVMTKPVPCPGECIYCPGVNSQPGEPVAQSYTGREPAALRSLMYDYDPFKQVTSRIEDLSAIGHACDKIELIVMGGTFLSAPNAYQESFVKGCIDGILGTRTGSIVETKKKAETSKRRLIGVTFETRPDYCMSPQVDAMLNYGGTRVEIGVQTIYNDVLKLINRGHDLETSKKAIQVTKDAGFKVCLHLMPNLPGTTEERDRQMFTTIFEDNAFKPDYLKIYPCLVIGGTKLEEIWNAGEYKPYPTEKLIDILADVKASIPEWIRIQRVQRDIPAYLILDGVKNSNLRELIWNKMDEKHENCNCIRCREYGFSRKRKPTEKIPDIDGLEIREHFYDASEGKECFITAVNPATDDIFGYVRLRNVSKYVSRPEFEGNNSSIVRELRVVGEIVPVNKIAKELQAQHRGLGKKLMGIAEDISGNRFKSHKLLVIAGIGARPYFYNLGFQPDGPYVSKYID
ncbi:MAG: tRNA uridine(34) 5-carboxymethylaminomethyl modification radical SAM/GNAT enzyme Elp3 [Candidatus Hodarchaeota archaeon]